MLIQIRAGKHFFKLRYLAERLHELQSLSYEIVKKDNETSKVTINPADKNVIKYTGTFLQKLEKAIFSFNIKKYENSYQYLLNSKIINDEDEFSEVLLVFHGFDKSIVGEFLSKEKPPNVGHKVLISYMNKINFYNAPFIDAFRFILSRLNLPSDAALLLTIVDKFTVAYFKFLSKIVKINTYFQQAILYIY